MLFGGKPKEELVLVLDIESSTVGAGLVLFKESDIPKVLYSTRVPVSIEDEVATKGLLPPMLKYLDEALSNVTKDGMKHLNFRSLRSREVKRVFCVLSTPWHISHSHSVEQSGKDILVTKDLLDKIVEGETAELSRKLPEEYADSALGKDVELIEKQITGIELNGYETPDPFGKKADRVELSVFMSLSPAHVLEGIERVVGKYFHPKHIDFHGSTAALSTLVRDIFVEPANFLVFDVGKERINISLVEHKQIRESLSATYGEGDAARGVAKTLHILPSVALSYLNMYAEGNLDPGSRESMSKAISTAELEWGKLVFPILEYFAEKHSLPKRVFLSAPHETMDLFSVWIREVLTRLGVNSIITPISNDVIEHFVRSDTLVDHGVVTQSIYYNKLMREVQK